MPSRAIRFSSMRNAKHHNAAVLALEENAVIADLHAPTIGHVAPFHIDFPAVGIARNRCKDFIGFAQAF